MSDGDDEQLSPEAEEKLRKSLQAEAAGTKLPRRDEDVGLKNILRRTKGSEN